MPRGRKPKPPQLRLIEGNPGKRALKSAPMPPVSVGMTPPAHLNADAKRYWRSLLPELEVLGLLAKIDRAAIAVVCQSYGVWADSERRLRAYNASPAGQKVGAYLVETAGGTIMQHPLVNIAREARRDVVRFSVEFGMTPSARSRVDVTAGLGGGNRPPASKFSGLTGGGTPKA